MPEEDFIYYTPEEDCMSEDDYMPEEDFIIPMKPLMRWLKKAIL